MALAPTSNASAEENPIRVMVVDDSAIVRGLITRILESDAEIKVVSSVGDGLMALNAITRHEVDVIVLDIEMPRMDGLTALPKLIEARPGVKVVMASTLTRRNAEISMKALDLGASDYIPKPTTSGGIHSGDEFKRELIEKVRVLANRAPEPKAADVAAASPAPAARPAVAPREARPAAPAAAAPQAAGGKGITLRQRGAARPEVIAVGSSTGGPQALQRVLGNLPDAVGLPIVITQHMPATFTTILAEHIARASGRSAKEAEEGGIIQPGHIYVAPGDYHMCLERDGSNIVVRLNQDPPENFCRPAVDVMLRSVSKVYGANVLVMILTGMGHDGLAGSQVIVENGGTIIAQDEESSVVWGMPGAVATNGVCSAVLPVGDLPNCIANIVKGAGA
ncbi:MAG: chemotaxis response regulator protein-glutamate methylesterase [Rhodospirillaceae bacterium]|nr:chemotaxis response regulator protein-glutamate methylesterase [Rhodospirillaceae bacterium]|tara:strand:+ start:74 stop:1255 length:1182 start_codon:yes stop_codon:yes gene_type:complete